MRPNDLERKQNETSTSNEKLGHENYRHRKKEPEKEYTNDYEDYEDEDEIYKTDQIHYV